MSTKSVDRNSVPPESGAMRGDQLRRGRRAALPAGNRGVQAPHPLAILGFFSC